MAQVLELLNNVEAHIYYEDMDRLEIIFVLKSGKIMGYYYPTQGDIKEGCRLYVDENISSKELSNLKLILTVYYDNLPID
jgi:hypothetical protein